MPLKINGATNGSVTLAAPATGSDVTLTLPGSSGTVALTASPTFTGDVVWSSAILRAATSTVATNQTTTSTTYTDLATVGPAVTLTTGTKALVILTAYCYNGGAVGAALMSFAVSGATTIAATDTTALNNSAIGSGLYNTVIQLSAVYMLTTLTAGSNTFTCKYRGSSSPAQVYQNRSITVIDLGS